MAQGKEVKKQLAVLQAHSLRELISQVNMVNSSEREEPILREDIVKVFKEDETFFLLYYK